jgi:polysaccharide export outer membrane protein
MADYRAQDLPTELRAPDLAAAHRIDLAAIARQSLNADVIYPGDVLEVTLATGVEEREPHTWPLRVSEQGGIEVPLVGPLEVAGLALTEAEQRIRQVSIDRQIYRQPHVSVLMKRRQMIQVRVVGAVETPGVHELPAAGSDLLAALVAAGGLSDKAGTEIEVRHPNANQTAADQTGPEGVMLASFVESAESPPRIVRIDLADMDQDSSQLDLHVEDGSVVLVREKTKRSVSVIGLVQRPDNYELPADEPLRVLDALALAGGPTVSIADKVRVIRHTKDQEDPVTVAVSIKRAKQIGKENLLLTAGDVVVVEETPTTFVVETIRGFIRFGFTSAIPGL